MPRTARASICSAIAAVALAGSAAAQNEAKTGLTGAWFAEARYIEPWIALAELDTASTVLLLIRGDGTFTLHRAYPICKALNSDGGEVNERTDPLAYVDICREAAARAAQDGFVAATLRLSAAGRWQVGPDQRLRFISDATGPVPKWFASQATPAWLRARIEQVPSDIKRRKSFRAEQRLLGDMERNHGHRIATFFTTFFIFDGAALAFSAERGTLRLTDERGATLAFRAIRPEAFDAAMGAVSLWGLRFEYFDCLASRLDAHWTASGATKSELGLLGVVARRLAPLQARKRFASSLAAAGRKTESDGVGLTPEEERAFWSGTAYLLTHPADQAAMAGRFGAYLGCPERDSQ